MLAISLYCDSEAIMCRSYSNIYNGKSRHISIWHEYIQEVDCKWGNHHCQYKIYE
jgi:hypothetical protein